MRSIFIVGSGPNESTKVARMAAPVGVVNSPSIAHSASGMPRSNSAVAGAGNAALAVSDLDSAPARRHRRGHDAIHAQQVPADGGADDIGDRVGRPTSWK